MDEAAAEKSLPFASDAECDAGIARLGGIARDLASIETRKSEAIAAMTKRAEDAATPLIDERIGLEAKVKSWCESNRSRLTDGGERQTARFPSGECKWRKGKETVAIDREREDKVIEELEGRRLGRMLKVVKSIVKSAILREPDKVKGIRGITFVEAAESFSIEPVASPLVDRPPQETVEAA